MAWVRVWEVVKGIEPQQLCRRVYEAVRAQGLLHSEPAVCVVYFLTYCEVACSHHALHEQAQL